jgi:hypothetical protein
VLTNPAHVLGEPNVSVAFAPKPLIGIVKRLSILLPDHAAQRASRPPTPPREKRACWEPRPRRLRITSVGEQATGACIGTHFPQLLCRSRLRLCRRGCSLVLQSSHSALHVFVEEVSPVIHHRLKIWSGNRRLRFAGGFEPPRPPYGDRQPDEVSAIHTTDRNLYLSKTRCLSD